MRYARAFSLTSRLRRLFGGPLDATLSLLEHKLVLAGLCVVMTYLSVTYTSTLAAFVRFLVGPVVHYTPSPAPLVDLVVGCVVRVFFWVFSEGIVIVASAAIFSFVFVLFVVVAVRYWLGRRVAQQVVSRFTVPVWLSKAAYGVASAGILSLLVRLLYKRYGGELKRVYQRAARRNRRRAMESGPEAIGPGVNRPRVSGSVLSGVVDTIVLGITSVGLFTGSVSMLHKSKLLEWVTPFMERCFDRAISGEGKNKIKVEEFKDAVRAYKSAWFGKSYITHDVVAMLPNQLFPIQADPRDVNDHNDGTGHIQNFGVRIDCVSNRGLGQVWWELDTYQVVDASLERMAFSEEDDAAAVWQSFIQAVGDLCLRDDRNRGVFVAANVLHQPGASASTYATLVSIFNRTLGGSVIALAYAAVAFVVLRLIVLVVSGDDDPYEDIDYDEPKRVRYGPKRVRFVDGEGADETNEASWNALDDDFDDADSQGSRQHGRRKAKFATSRSDKAAYAHHKDTDPVNKLLPGRGADSWEADFSAFLPKLSGILSAARPLVSAFSAIRSSVEDSTRALESSAGSVLDTSELMLALDAVAPKDAPVAESRIYESVATDPEDWDDDSDSDATDDDSSTLSDNDIGTLEAEVPDAPRLSLPAMTRPIAFRVESASKNGVIRGTGCFVTMNSRPVLLTCQHVVGDSNSIVKVVIDGVDYGVEVAATDNDVVACQLPNEVYSKVKPLKVGSGKIGKGHPVVVCTTSQMSSGNVLGYLASWTVSGQNPLAATYTSGPGDSGAPVLLASEAGNGLLAGVHACSDRKGVSNGFWPLYKGDGIFASLEAKHASYLKTKTPSPAKPTAVAPPPGEKAAESTKRSRNRSRARSAKSEGSALPVVGASIIVMESTPAAPSPAPVAQPVTALLPPELPPTVVTAAVAAAPFPGGTAASSSQQ